MLHATLWPRFCWPVWSIETRRPVWPWRPRRRPNCTASNATSRCLDTVITLAPLLGLLGTITGMISAFGIVSESGLGQPHAITGGVAEALIATATGLAIAILTLVPYNYFRAKVEAITQLMEERATRLKLLFQALQKWES